MWFLIWFRILILNNTGANSYGQLGLGNKDDKLIPVQIESFASRRVFAGGGHSVIKSSDGFWYACGSNSSGQLGLPDSSVGLQHHVVKPEKIAFTDHTAIERISCGWDFTFILDKQGKIHALGSNTYGQLGLPDVPKTTPVATEVTYLQERVTDVACGLRHSIIATESGDVYCCGSTRKGQLGVTSLQPVAAIGVFTKADVAGCGKIVQVAAGAYHSAARTGGPITVCLDRGEVLVWGDNKHGQLAADPVHCTKVTQPRKVDPGCFCQQRVVRLLSGWTHMLAITETGSVYSWGRNDYCQLGRCADGTQTPFSPEVVPFPVAPTQIAVGSEHNLAIVDGRVHAWGWNEHGMCGSGDELNIATPRLVTSLKDRICSAVACGAGHSFAFCS